MKTKNLSQDEITRMLSAMQVSDEDDSHAEAQPDGQVDHGAQTPSDDDDGPGKTEATQADSPPSKTASDETGQDGLTGHLQTDAEPDGETPPDSSQVATPNEAHGAERNQPENKAQHTPPADEIAIDKPPAGAPDTFQGLTDPEPDAVNTAQKSGEQQQPANPPGENDTVAEVSDDSEAESLPHVEEDLTDDTPPDPTQRTEAEPEDEPTPPEPPPSGIRKKTRIKKKKDRTAIWITLAACTLLVLIPIGIHISNVKEEMAEKAKAEQLAAEEENRQQQQPDEDSGPEENIEAVKRDPMKLAFEKQLSEMQILREELLIKEGQIEELKQEYQLKINSVEDEIIKIKNQVRIRTLQEARKNNSIELNLQTIQRRMAYIRGLDRPAGWLRLGGETLLFQIRKSGIDLMAADTADGIDLAGLMQENDRIIARYTPNPEKLAADLSKENTPGLGDIWQAVLLREKESILTRMVDKKSSQRPPVESKMGNQKIWDEICNGNFNHKSQLSELSPRAAECLAHWKEADLFLNRIYNLSPKAARNLFAWKGNWICMNGIKDLSPDVARHLFQWKGRWVSLNGLPALSFETTMYLPNWKGERLELMGLKPEQMIGDPLALKHLAEWENAGGKLYVSDRVRELIHMVH